MRCDSVGFERPVSFGELACGERAEDAIPAASVTPASVEFERPVSFGELALCERADGLPAASAVPASLLGSLSCMDGYGAAPPCSLRAASFMLFDDRGVGECANIGQAPSCAASDEVVHDVESDGRDPVRLLRLEATAATFGCWK